jgi:cellulose synthase/poly-beta-1,6-N-acetylglucosamine synthase-like glycosyltransferase/peptidoglycan/xylan/chitin deacetylase (PgdA/CDA1 family)
LKEITNRGVGGLALSRVGLEDPAVWDVLRCGSECKPNEFQVIRPPNEVSGIGDGDFITVANSHREGARVVKEDRDGLWREEYLRPPEAAVVYHQGGSDRRMVSITFDDGPDPTFTPQILDILRDARVSATFFIVGKNAVAHPEIVSRMQREGHEIGNHTYSHVNLASSGALRLTLELNATQRIIENLTGRSTLLFRPPYDVDRTPQTADELDALLEAQRLGYLPVMASIDPMDWSGATSAEILERVKDQRSQGSTLLLHDGGGDRTATVAALPKILEYFSQRGDLVVPLYRQIRVAREVLMPPVSKDAEASARYVAGTGISIISVIEGASFTFLFGITVLLVARTVILVLLAVVQYLRDADRKSRVPLGSTREPVSIVIAAYNEERGIAATIRSILSSGYRGPLELVVVDDGSQDRTASVVAGIQGEHPEVRLISQANKGKAEALSAGIEASVHPWIVTFDADTECMPGCIEHLVQPLRDPYVGAVSGNIKVRNCETLLGRMQALEYEIAFSVDKRAHDLIGAIIVAPGAGSAYRRSAIVAAGGLSGDTLAEDTDLTLEMHRRDFRTCYAPEAMALTEAPETVRLFLRQRKRWSFGTLQCLWKHKNLLFRLGGGALSWFAIPSVWICHLGVTALTPIVDLAFIIGLLGGVYPSIIWYSLTFMVIDVLLAALAVALDGGIGWRILWAIPMRFLYRPLLSFAVIASLVRALKGQLVGWGAQERIGVQTVGK